MRAFGLFALLVAVSFVSLGCPKPTGTVSPPISGAQTDYNRPLPPGELGLRKITDPRDIPDFTRACANLVLLRQTVANSLDYMAKPSSQKFFPYGKDVTHAQATASLKAFAALLDAGLTPEQLNAQIREKFDVYISVGCDNRGTVLFTGYYTPIFNASAAKTDKFKYPIYKQPGDLVKNPDGTIRGRLNPADGSITPYPNRREIEITKMLAGSELYWLSDPFEVFIAHVQGSARLRLTDGRMVTVG